MAKLTSEKLAEYLVRARLGKDEADALVHDYDIAVGWCRSSNCRAIYSALIEVRGTPSKGAAIIQGRGWRLEHDLRDGCAYVAIMRAGDTGPVWRHLPTGAKRRAICNFVLSELQREKGKAANGLD